MKFEIKAYNLQELGQRQNQEDSLYPALGQSTNDDRLFILCDGMGGHEKGEVASATVCETMSKTLFSMWKPTQPLTDDMFQKALDAAYDALDAKDHGEERKMGTTMTFVCLHADGVTVAHIGDSRIYQVRPASGNNPAKIVFRTQDHSLVNDLVRVGEITEEEAKHHPQKNVITRAMQPCQEYRAKADIEHLVDVQAGDYFYMCSDGMLEETSDENILNILTVSDRTDEQKIETLRGITEENKDNHTAHLIHILEVEGAANPNFVRKETERKGTMITPEFDNAEANAVSSANALNGTSPVPPVPAKKKRSTLPLIFGAVVVAAVAIGATFLLQPRGEKETDETADKQIVDSIDDEVEQSIITGPRHQTPTKTATAQTAKRDTAKHNQRRDTASTPTPSHPNQPKVNPEPRKSNETVVQQAIVNAVKAQRQAAAKKQRKKESTEQKVENDGKVQQQPEKKSEDSGSLTTQKL